MSKDRLLHGLIAALITLWASSAIAQQNTNVDAIVLPFGDLVVLAQDGSGQNLRLTQFSGNSEVTLDQFLQLGRLNGTAKFRKIFADRLGDFGMVAEFRTGGVQKLGLLQVDYKGNPRGLSATSGGAQLTARGVLAIGDTAYVAGESVSGYDTNSAAALTVLKPNQPGKTVLRDSAGQDVFLSVRLLPNQNLLALGLTQKGPQGQLFLAEFDQALNHKADRSLDIASGFSAGDIIAVAHSVTGFLVAIREPAAIAANSFYLLHISNSGEVFFAQNVRFPTAVNLRGIVELPDRRVILDTDILDGPNGQSGVFGRYFAAMNAGVSVPLLATRNLDALVIPPVGTNGQLIDLLGVEGSDLLRMPLSLDQFEWEETRLANQLPANGIGGLKLLGGADTELTVRHQPGNICRLELVSGPDQRVLLSVQAGPDFNIVGYSDKTLAVWGARMTIGSGTRVDRVDLIAPEGQTAPRIAARLRQVARTCR